MLKKETMGYIIEKMRGDSLTPLGTGKGVGKSAELLSYKLIDLALKDDAYAFGLVFDDICKYLVLGSPLFRGSWSRSNVSIGNDYNRCELIHYPRNKEGKLSSLTYLVNLDFKKTFSLSFFEVHFYCLSSRDALSKYSFRLLKSYVPSTANVPHEDLVKITVNAGIDFVEKMVGVVGGVSSMNKLRDDMAHIW